MGWKLNSCCCCFELKTGVVIIGILGLIGGITILITPFSGNDVACNKFYMKNCSDFTDGETAGITIWNLANILFTIMLIYGSQKHKPTFILPVIIVSIFGLIYYLVIIWAVMIVAFNNGETEIGVIILIFGHALWNVMFYFFMVIYSRYKDLRADQLPAYPKENSPLYP
ncbi:hypothetical protein G9C98_001549 [Cotesia typhae]|uniref:Uncharacterized protein n=1 Tax=Cotesia typhae TaxID=2053667 RepID=A0A8J5V626_9HYME|nr:hypothetical protein G9C98_001549 [Cotesia typhae]